MADLPFNYKYIPSPNQAKGRKAPITTIVIHWIVGNLASADRQFTSRSSGVSAHYAVEENEVHQYVDEDNTAYHAISANAFSIGIEHSAAPGRAPSDGTYATSAKLIARICKERGLNVDTALQPHCRYVSTRCPGTDINGNVDEAGGIDIARLKREAKAALGSVTVTPKPPAPVTPAAPALKTVSTIAREVIDGKWGNGDDRKNRLQKAGYSFNTVQAEVNRLLKGGSTAPALKSTDTVAREVIAGKWGNGTDRINRLRGAGYNPTIIQARVNQIL